LIENESTNCEKFGKRQLSLPPLDILMDFCYLFGNKVEKVMTENYMKTTELKKISLTF